GRVGLFTQSAGVATLTLSRALERGCGISSFVASGAFADVTANDLMQYWSDDPDTDICLLTLDAIGNPRKFFRVLRRLALEKPVVIFTPAGRCSRRATTRRWAWSPCPRVHSTRSSATPGPSSPRAGTPCSTSPGSSPVNRCPRGGACGSSPTPRGSPGRCGRPPTVSASTPAP
ncbi:MAG TPA: hypothetical protein GXZ33_00890, partial [Corynebacterium sp.]|nr:hypothetical protein [Corynebacterium sp.]